MTDYWRIGDVELWRVEERYGPDFAADYFFPDHDPAVIAENSGWMVPDHWTADGTHLVFAIHSLVIRTEGQVFVLDTGIGNGKQRPVPAGSEFPAWTNLQTPYLDRFRATGIAPEEVDFVIFSHLHVDHVGWNTRLENGTWVPTFPNARYLFPKTEFDYWIERNARDKAKGRSPVAMGAIDDSVLPIVEAGLADIVEDEQRLCSALRFELAVGHSPGHRILHVESGGERAVLAGDAIHHPLQMANPDWTCRFDIWPDEAKATRRRLVGLCRETGAMLTNGHLARPHALRLDKDGGFDWVPSVNAHNGQ